MVDVKPEKFRIYKKSNMTKVAEGAASSATLTISGVGPNTAVLAGDYFAVGVATVGGAEKESAKVDIPAFTTALPAPVNATGTLNADGSVAGNWDAIPGAQAYLVHYGDANVSDPHQAVKMGYSETNSWTLAAADVPALEEGDKIYFYVQAYDELGIGANEIEKARYLHDGDFLGSAWSEPVVLTKTPEAPLEEGAPTSENTIPEIKSFLDEQGIEYKSNAKKAELLSLIN